MFVDFSADGVEEAVQELLAETKTAALPDAPESAEMAAASKELSPEKEAASSSNDQKDSSSSASSSSMFSLIYSTVKKVVTVGIIYCVGYMGWSVAWLIG